MKKSDATKAWSIIRNAVRFDILSRDEDTDSSVDEQKARKAHSDLDEYFQYQRKKANKISPAKERALASLTHQWQSAYTLKAGLNTLRALCRDGLAESPGLVGCHFSTRVNLLLRLKENKC